MQDELLPCPFCGAYGDSPMVIKKLAQVICVGCFVLMPAINESYATHVETAIKKWNTRTDNIMQRQDINNVRKDMLPDYDELVEKMAEAIDSIADNHISTMGKLNCPTLAEAALQALLQSLPEPDGKCPHGCHFAKNTHSNNYMKLLSMRKIEKRG